MSDERKIQNEIINYSVYRGKQTYASEMKRKRCNLGTQSCLTASDEKGNSARITVYSIQFTTNGLLTNSDFKLCSLTVSQITEVKKTFIHIQEIWEVSNS